MYLELIITATAVQQELANAYVQSNRMPEIGQYFLAINLANVSFFEQIEAPSRCADLHRAFLDWQTLGNQALAEELKAGMLVESEITRRFAASSKHFSDTLIAFRDEASHIQP